MEARYVLGPSTHIKLDGNEWTQISQADEEDGFRGQGTDPLWMDIFEFPASCVGKHILTSF